MGKRVAQADENEDRVLKDGQRPLTKESNEEGSEFEDEFEDEFESENEIFEAGEDGRPDEDREADESRGTWIMLKALCEPAVSNIDYLANST